MYPHKRFVSAFVLLFSASFCAQHAIAQVSEPIVYPNKGQSPQQVEKDEAECQGWAKQTTGFDPLAPAPSQAPSGGTGGSTARGAVGGAAAGAAIGAIAGDEAGKGAAIGGIVGGMMSHRQASEHKKAKEDQQKQAANQYQAQRGEFMRAYGACLEGRNYTVK